MSANETQVGGDHYKKHGDLQHWDLVVKFGWDYFQGQIIKYVMRHKDKHGLVDLKKAAHFLQKYIELEEQELSAVVTQPYEDNCPHRHVQLTVRRLWECVACCTPVATPTSEQRKPPQPAQDVAEQRAAPGSTHPMVPGKRRPGDLCPKCQQIVRAAENGQPDCGC